MSEKSKKAHARRHIKRKKSRKRIVLVSAFVLISVVVAAWYVTSRSTPMPTPTGALVVHTVDEFTDEPLSEVTIGIVGLEHEATVQSNEQGEYRFESIPAGAYLVAAWSSIYHTHTGSREFPLGIDVEAAETTDVTIELHGHA